ncbi:MAG TPA: membrane protein insertion efficiency factor YidD [Burkholderiaceae bacterium]|jgi:putative component of membrane protein insertase Oxa1/YidC/SpoIIIJ protein YidD
MLRYVGVGLIRGYQRYLSPRKGYRCAYGVLHGSGTCSSVGLDIMRDRGVLAFLRLMPLQFDACRAAVTTLQRQSEEEKRRRNKAAEDGKRNSQSGCSGADWSDCDSGDTFTCGEIGECEALECGECEFGSCD